MQLNRVTRRGIAFFLALLLCMTFMLSFDMPSTVKAQTATAQAIYNNGFDDLSTGWQSSGSVSWRDAAGYSWSYPDIQSGSIWQTGWHLPVSIASTGIFSIAYRTGADGPSTMTILCEDSGDNVQVTLASWTGLPETFDLTGNFSLVNEGAIIDGVRFDSTNQLQIDWVSMLYPPISPPSNPMYPVTTDYQTNGDMESGNDSWDLTDSAMVSLPHTGDYSLDIYAGSTSAKQTFDTPIFPSSVWQAHVWLKCVAGYTNTKISLWVGGNAYVQDLWTDSGSTCKWIEVDLLPLIHDVGVHGNITAISFTSDSRARCDYLVDDLLIQTASFTLTANALGGGSVNPTGESTHAYNSVVSVLASSENDTLGYWLLNGTNVGETNPLAVNMTGDYSLTAVFSSAIPTPTPVPAGSGPGPIVKHTPTPRPTQNVNANSGEDFVQSLLDTIIGLLMNPWVWLLLILLLLLVIGMYVYKKYKKNHG